MHHLDGKIPARHPVMQFPLWSEFQPLTCRSPSLARKNGLWRFSRCSSSSDLSVWLCYERTYIPRLVVVASSRRGCTYQDWMSVLLSPPLETFAVPMSSGETRLLNCTRMTPGSSIQPPGDRQKED